MKPITKVLIGLSVLVGILVFINVFLLIKYPMVTKLIPILPIKI